MACLELLTVLCPQDEQAGVNFPAFSCGLHSDCAYSAWLACRQGCRHGDLPGSARQ